MRKSAPGPQALLVALDFPPSRGGIQTMLHALCCHARALNITALVPANADARAFDARQEYPIIRVGLPGLRPAAYLPQLLLHACRLTTVQRFDLLLLGHPMTLPIAMGLRRVGRRMPAAVFVYGSDVSVGWSRRLARLFLKQAGAVIAISHATKAHAVRLGAEPSRIMVTPMGVDERHLQPARGQLPAAWGLLGRRVILTVARLDQWRKGHDTVLAALPAVIERVPEVCYVVAGSGPLQPALEARAKNLKVADHCLFIGPVSNEQLSALYQVADVFVMPSRRDKHGQEGFGLVYLEANGHGKPVIAGRVPGADEAVIDGETGLLVDPTQPDAVAQAITRLLLDEPLRRRLGDTGRERAEQLTWPKVVQSIEQHLVQLGSVQ